MRLALPFFALIVSAAAEDSSLTIARKLTNPFADVINVPINQNPDFGMGDGHGRRYTITLQPVIPFAINQDWNLISRTVVPYISQEDALLNPAPKFPGLPEGVLAKIPAAQRGAAITKAERTFNAQAKQRPADVHQDGLGDTAQSFFLSPTNATDNGWCWGIGPIFMLPTATEDRFGSDQLSIGPTVGLLKRAGPWTIGALMNHTWSLQGDDQHRSEVNATFLQPFIDYTTESKTTFSINTESTYDWARGQWTVPINCVVRQLFDLGGMKMSVALGPRFYLEGPSGAPEWGARLGVTLIFPK